MIGPCDRCGAPGQCYAGCARALERRMLVASPLEAQLEELKADVAAFVRHIDDAQNHAVARTARQIIAYFRSLNHVFILSAEDVRTLVLENERQHAALARIVAQADRTVPGEEILARLAQDALPL